MAADTITNEDIAHVCHEANRIYAQIIGDPPRSNWEYESDMLKNSVISGVKKILSGEVGSPQVSHKKWYDYKIAEGWRYGPERNDATMEHPCLVSWKDLPIEQRRKDELFFAIVKALS